MKTHEHAAISVGYAGIIAFLSGQGLTDPYMYLAAIAGGEIIDFIDHPLYQLVYGRNDPQVIKTRELVLHVHIKEAISYMKEVEDRRGYVKLYLHNVYALSLVVLLGIIW